MAQLNKIKEVALIDSFSRRLKLKSKSVVVSIGDDAAVVSCRRNGYELLTSDMLIEGVHFRKKENLSKVGYKALAVCISDIAAMGGLPCYALVSLGLPKKTFKKSGLDIMGGISRCAEKYGVDVIGGDTNSSPIVVVDVSMVGYTECENLVLRSNARPKDKIFVSGPLGGSIKGRHLSFEPRIRESRFLVNNFNVTSMMDISDGLAQDLSRLVDASKTGAVLFSDSVPLSKGVNNIKNALFDGEDFELLFTLSENDSFRLESICKKRNDLKFYRIGEITDSFKGVKLLDSSGRLKRLKAGGFLHF